MTDSQNQSHSATDVPACILTTACGDGIIRFIDATYYQYSQFFAQLDTSIIRDLNNGRAAPKLCMNFTCMELTKTNRFLFVGGNAYSPDESKLLVISMDFVKRLQHAFLDTLFQGGKPQQIFSLNQWPNNFKQVGMQNRAGRRTGKYYNIISIKAYHEDQVLVASEEGMINIFEATIKKDSDTGITAVDCQAKPGVVINHDSSITCVALDPKNPTSIFVSDKKGKIVIYDLSRVDEISGTFKMEVLQQRKIEMSTVPDNESDKLKNLKSYYNTIEVDPTGKFLAAGDRHGDITIFGLKRNRKDEDQVLYQQGMDQIVPISGGDVLKVFNGHNYYVSKIKFNRSGRYLFSVSADNILYGLKFDESKDWKESIKVEVNKFVEYEVRDSWIWDLAVSDADHNDQTNKEEVMVWTTGADRIPKLWSLNLSDRKANKTYEIGALDRSYNEKHFRHCNYSKKALTENRHDHPDLSISDKEYEKMLMQNVEYLDNCYTFSYGAVYACHLLEGYHSIQYRNNVQ